MITILHSVGSMLDNLYATGHKRFTDHTKGDSSEVVFKVSQWLTGEENLQFNRLMKRQESILKAMDDYKGLTFSKSNGYPDFSHINTSGTHCKKVR